MTKPKPKVVHCVAVHKYCITSGAHYEVFGECENRYMIKNDNGTPITVLKEMFIETFNTVEVTIELGDEFVGQSGYGYNILFKGQTHAFCKHMAGSKCEFAMRYEDILKDTKVPNGPFDYLRLLVQASAWV